MLIEVMLFLCAGLALGTFAGLLPGLHPNTLLVLLFPLFWITGSLSPYCAMALIVSMAVSNSVMSFIPSIFLGAPEPDTCLSTLPGHAMLMEGRGHEALFLSVAGAVCATVITLAALPLVLWGLPLVYGAVRGYIHILLFAVIASLLLQERRGKAWSAFMFAAAGAAGTMLLSHFSSHEVLLPALSGLFGLPTLLASTLQGSVLPAQKRRRDFSRPLMKGTVSGWMAGLLVGILPGIGPAQAGVLASRLVRGKREDFLVALGGIASANTVFAFIALHALGKTRSGAAWALSGVLGGMGAGELYFSILVASFSCFTASFTALAAGRGILSVIGRADYRHINVSVIAAMVLTVGVFTSFSGILILLLTSVLGVSCSYMGVKRMYMMGFLMLPTMLYYSGFGFA